MKKSNLHKKKHDEKGLERKGKKNGGRMNPERGGAAGVRNSTAK